MQCEEDQNAPECTPMRYAHSTRVWLFDWLIGRLGLTSQLLKPGVTAISQPASNTGLIGINHANRLNGMGWRRDRDGMVRT